MDIKILLIICGVFAFINAAPVKSNNKLLREKRLIPGPVVTKELKAAIDVWSSLPIIGRPIGLIQAVANLFIQPRVKRDVAIQFRDKREAPPNNWFYRLFNKIIDGAAFIVNKLFG